ncbi:MAG: ABC transporter ATP-binding protein [Polyangiaceae bacterium]|nr:ABC transporter ATP-binding protein [Polyangiaceae bacterium]
MPDPIVVCEGLQKTFVHMGRPLEVLRGIDLRIDQGEVVAIVGQSGAGKSTLLHIIGTLDVPSKGRIRLGREDVTGLSSGKLAAIRNRTIGFVFQFHHLLPEFSALENVMMPGLIQGKSQREMEKPAMSLLEEVGLKSRATHRPGELSGGEQQRVALARALVLSPKLLLADEPTGNLDSKTGQQIQNQFFEMNKRHGTTIVVVTHDLSFARSMPRVVTMKDGLVDSDERMPGREASADKADEAPPSPSSRGDTVPARAVEG